MMICDLYSPQDIKKVRSELLISQKFRDALTLLPLEENKSVVDHAHDDKQLIRGVIHRNVNSALGRIENAFLRDLKWWYPCSLPVFLRAAADYLESESTKYRHPNFKDKLKTNFKKLPAGKQDDVIIALQGILGKEIKLGKNSKSRLEIFNSLVLDRGLGFDIINSTIQKYSQKED